MAKFQYNGTGAKEYPTLGFTATTGGVASLVKAPDGNWAQVADGTTVTLVPHIPNPQIPTYVEPTDQSFYLYDASGNQPVWVAPEDVILPGDVAPPDDAGVIVHVGNTNIVTAYQKSGDPFPWFIVFGDRRIMLLDGQTDPATIRASVGDENTAKLFIQGEGTSGTVLALKASATDSTIHSLFTVSDYRDAPIEQHLNAGGIKVNDRISTDLSVYGPDWITQDIYGYRSSRGSASFAHAGPPGNALDMPTATAEGFEGARAAGIGTWGSAFGVTGIESIVNPDGGINNNPGETFHLLQFTILSGTNLTVATGYNPTTHEIDLAHCTPCVPGNYVKSFTSIRSNSSRVVTPYIVFVNSSGAAIGGTLTGSSITTTGTFQKVFVGGLAPVNAAGYYFTLGAPSCLLNEVFQCNATGSWTNNSTSGATDPNPNNVWSPPYTGQNASGVKTGDDYKRVDTDLGIFMLDGAPNTFYLPRVVGAPGSSSQPRWVSINAPAIPGGGGGGGEASTVRDDILVLKEGVAADGDTFLAGIPAHLPMTTTDIIFTFDGGPVANIGVIEIKVKGPSSPAEPTLKATYNIPVGSTYVYVSSQTIGRQIGDRLIPVIKTASGMKGIVATFFSNTAIPPATVATAPTITAVSTSGLSANQVKLTVTPPVTPGGTVTGYMWSTDNGLSGGPVTLDGSNQVVIGGLTAVAQTIKVAAVTSAGTGAFSAVSSTFTPIASSTNQLLPGEANGSLGWNTDFNSSVTMAMTTPIRPGSGATSVLQIVGLVGGSLAQVFESRRYARTTSVAKTIECYIYNPQAYDLTANILEDFFVDSNTGNYLGNSDPGAPTSDVNIPAGTWVHLSRSSTNATAGIGAAFFVVRFSPVNNGDIIYMSEALVP